VLIDSKQRTDREQSPKTGFFGCQS